MLKLTSAVLAISLALAGCGSSDGGDQEVLRLYTSVTRATVDAVVERFQETHPNVAVETFRAPTGELVARIAAEQRSGGVRADVLWLTDPVSMFQYENDELLLNWTPKGAEHVPAAYRTPGSWGTRILTMVAIHGSSVPAPDTWWDLTGSDYTGSIVLPDPGFAGSALAAMGYFALDDQYGFSFYETLLQNGASQVSSPGEVVNGVAEGQYSVGITLAYTADQAIANGSPIEVAWPDPGGIAIYSPVAVVSDSANVGWARSLVEFLLSPIGQESIAATGWQPIRQDVEWKAGGPVVHPDWSAIVEQRADLLARYRTLFGG